MEMREKHLSADRRSAMQSALLAWYERSGRSFPWRSRSDPYEILVLEVMSQQTQLGRIADAWEAFLERWPDPRSLADASAGDVIGFWSTHRLGYNRRAEYLHRAAHHIVSEWDGELPAEPERLEELDGVGPYTSRAVASFAFGAPHAVVDTNVERVLGRAFDAGEAEYASIANEILPPADTAAWNGAMMDLGATVCTPDPACDDCPWQDWCVAFATDDFSLSDGRTASQFEGSRRQYRGRIVRTLASDGATQVDELGQAIHDAFGEDGDHDRDWLCDLLTDLEAEGLVTFDGTTVSLP